MMSHKRAPSSGSSHPRRNEQFKDEVYRQMFRLEANRPGAEMDLALALLRAWQVVDSRAEGGEERQWLRKVAPICMEMIEEALRHDDAAPSTIQ